MSSKDPKRNIPYSWAATIAAIACFASYAGGKYGAGLSGVVAAVLAVAVFFPVMAGAVFFQVAARSITPDPFSKWWLRLIGTLSFAISVLVVTSVFWNSPLPIKVALFPAPAQLPIKLEEVVVHADTAICTLPSEAPLKEDNKSIVRLAPGERVVFEEARTTKWTADRFNGLEAASSVAPLLMDLGPLISHYKKECEEDKDRFFKYLEGEFETLVKKGLTSARQIAMEQHFRDVAVMYVKERFIPLLQNEQSRTLGNYHKVNLREINPLDPYVAASRPFWKRLLIQHLVSYPELIQEVQGPYYGVNPENSALPNEALSNFPTRRSKFGSLVAGKLERQSNGSLLLPLEKAQKFCEKGDFVENTADTEALVVLGINDNLPDDNGPGYAEVRFHRVRARN